MIEFTHDDFFTLLDGKKLNHMKISTHAKSIVILHPKFPFDPNPSGGYARNLEMEIQYEEPVRHQYTIWDNRFEIMPNEIYHQEFRLDQLLDFAFVQNFVEGCLEAYSSIAISDEMFWYDTGYWSSRCHDDQFIGIGINTLEKAFRTIESDMFICCLANRDSIVMIQGSPRENSKNPMTSVNTYVTNAFLPFTETADIFRSSIRMLGECRNLKEEFILETAIHSRYPLGDLFSVHPRAFVMMESYPVLAVIENPARQASQLLTSLDLMMGTISGGFTGNDLVSEKKFRLRVDEWALGNTNLFQFFFTRELSFDRLLNVLGLANALR